MFDIFHVNKLFTTISSKLDSVIEDIHYCKLLTHTADDAKAKHVSQV